MLKLGIGVVTYNRAETVLRTLDLILQHTRRPFCLVVADDGSIDATPDLVRAKRVPVITGPNSGVAWNKNRALFYLTEIARCDVSILLEDDARPMVNGWEEEWIAATARWHHLNFAAHWIADTFVSGAGTARDPVFGKNVTAQCTSFSAEALAFAGYMDTRFKGFGFEHVEHTWRIRRLGFGGEQRMIDGQEHWLWAMIVGGIEVVPTASHADREQIDRNLKLCHAIMHGPIYRTPWRNEEELNWLRGEIRGCV